MSLFLGDKPLSYNPSRGPEVAFELQFKGNPGQNGATDNGQPGIFTVGTNWHTPWRSYIQQSVSGPTTGDEMFFVFLGDGSARQYPVNRIEPSSRAMLETNNGDFQLTFPSGARNVYGQKVTMGGNDYWFLTRKEDAAGHAITFSYAFTTDGGGATNSVRLDKVTDVDNRDTTFVYTNSGNYSNILIEVQGPYGLTAKLAHDGSTQLTNIIDVVSLSSRIEYDGSKRLSKLITPYGTNSFIHYDTNGWKALVVEELGVRRRLHLEGVTVTNVLSTALVESAALNELLTSNSLPATAQTNFFDERNTFYWGPRQYANLPSAIRTALTNLTFDPANLTTNDYKLGWTRHWLRARNTNVVILSGTLSVERAPSPDANGATEGLLTWHDYDGKDDTTAFNGLWEYAPAAKLPRTIASREPGQDWRVSYFQRYGNGHVTLKGQTYGIPGSVGWRFTTNEYAANQIDLTMVIENGVTNALNVFNDHHQVTTNYNALNEITTFTYDGSQRLSTITRPNGLVTTYAYDGSSGFLSTVIDSYSGTDLRTNSYTHTNGYVLTHTDERSLSTTNTWDALGRLTKTANREGAINHTYEKLDLVKTLDRMGFTNGYAYNGYRELLRHTNANKAVTTYAYCNCGSLESITDPLGNTTSYTYDNLGRRTRTTFPTGGGYVDFTYNLLGRVTRTADNLGVSVTNFYTVHGLAYTASNTFGRVFLHAYDDDDRLIGSTDRNGVSLGFSYDDLGRLLVRTNRTFYIGEFDDIEVWADRFDYTNNTAQATAGYRTYTYAAYITSAGWGFATTYRIGELIVFDYDLFARKTNEVHWDTNNVTVLTNAFAYNAAGDLTKLTDGKAQTTTWKYDEFGRVTNKLDAAGAELVRYTYDANSRLATRWTPAKLTTAYSYDAVGNLTLINYPVSPDITLQYDELNRVTNMVDAVGATAYSFTAFGALQSEDGPWADDTVSYSYTANRLRSGLSLTQPSATAWSQSYAHDAANRLSTLTSPAGAFGYEYGSVGTDSTPSQLIRRLTLPGGSAITNLFDEQARHLGTYLRNSSGTNLNSHSYDYNDLDQRTKQTRKDGDYVTYGYDALGQLVDATGKESGGTTIRVHERFGYAYDAAGNLNRRTNNALVQTFTVNNLNQLSNATRSGNLTVAGFTFTPASSVTVNTLTADRYADNTFTRTNLSLSDGNNTFTAVATDSLGRCDTNAITVNLPATLTFLYDQNGNLRTNGTKVLEYDDENQLTRITEPNAWKSEFTYDGKMRLRISRDFEWRNGSWVQTNEVRRVYDGMLVLQERDSFNLPKLTYTRGKDLSGSLEGAGGIGGLLALSQDSSTPSPHLYFHSDGNGNVTCLVDANQTVVARYLYDPFGNTLSATGPKAALNKYRFSSKEWHGPSGMVYYGYRWYVPELQRWPNQDPIGEMGGINLYGYVENDPINYFDPFGLDSTKISPEAAKIALDLLADELGIPLPDLNLANALTKKLAKKGIQKSIEQAHELNQAAKQAKKIKDNALLFQKCKVKDSDEFHKLKKKLSNKFDDQLKGETNPDLLFDDQGRVVLRSVNGKVTAPTGLTIDEARKLLGLPAVP